MPLEGYQDEIYLTGLSGAKPSLPANLFEFSVLVVTLDSRLLGWRPRDLANAFLPFLRGIGVQNYFSDPAFVAGAPGDDLGSRVLHWAQMFGDSSLTWSDLPSCGRTGTGLSCSRGS